jgi:nicotinamidase-related amidase
MRKLLVVVDYQKDFVNGALGFKKAETLEEGIYNKVKSYLDNGDTVLFTYDTHKDNYLETREGKNLPVSHCILGTKGHELFGRLVEFKDVENTMHYNKEVFALSPESLIKIREELGDNIEEVELLGVVTNMCVISNAVSMQTIFPNAKISVDGSLCASFDDELHEKALEILEGIQINIKGV